jgi:predicted dehydrogenase
LKVLIIGFGSIGKRHFEILNALEPVSSVSIVSKQNIQLEDTVVYEALSHVKKITDYDYFVIASETNKHYQQLKYICDKVSGKKIIVEKPLFDKQHEVFECNNKVFTAYNLRFHPVIEQLKRLIKNEQVCYVNAICGQYLPQWRPEQDYRQSYSADIKQGGGILRDLSHELDYLTWLFGEFKNIDAINTKVSDLDISSDDIFTAIAVTESKVIINVTVDYISKTPIRRLIIHTLKNTLEVNVINNSIVIYDKKSNKKVIDVNKEDRNYSYTKMHESIINNNFNTACSFDEGKNIVNIIDSISFKEL